MAGQFAEINIGSIVNDRTGDAARVAGAKLNYNFGLMSSMFGDGTDLTNRLSLTDNGLRFNGGLQSTTLHFDEDTSSIVYNLPTLSGSGVTQSEIVTKHSNQTILNKTLDNPQIITPEIADTTGDHNYVFTSSELTADRTVTLPVLLSDDTLVFESHTQTISNKTFTNTTLTSPTIGSSIVDANGATMASITPVASSVNHIDISNNSANNAPSITASGTDTNIHLNLDAKGSGVVMVSKPLGFLPETVSSSVPTDVAKPLTVYDPSVALSTTLANATFTGQRKLIANKGTGDATITPATFANGTSITIRQWGAVELLWIDNSDGWVVMGYKYPSSDTNAPYYITT